MLFETLIAIRNERLSFKDGLSKATKYVEENGGFVEEVKCSNGGTYYELILGNESVSAFQPYPDIDSFYFDA